MDSIEQRIERLEYYHKLMMGLVENEQWPFHHLIMNRQLTEEEVRELFHMCEDLTEEYKRQKAEGFVGFTPLLQTFKQLLNPKLSSLEVMDALQKEQLYVPLMTALRQAVIDDAYISG
ncbi:DUF1878 family protein [Bacillus sp. DJP31]|uniref:DUF1878 family protein n=1 Tax=Bacillus sp. DJP31 TaxID=3409789 RepID=UPI003BB80DA2